MVSIKFNMNFINDEWIVHKYIASKKIGKLVEYEPYFAFRQNSSYY